MNLPGTRNPAAHEPCVTLRLNLATVLGNNRRCV